MSVVSVSEMFVWVCGLPGSHSVIGSPGCVEFPLVHVLFVSLLSRFSCIFRVVARTRCLVFSSSSPGCCYVFVGS